MKRNLLLLAYLLLLLFTISQTTAANGQPVSTLVSIAPSTGNAGERVNVTIVGKNTHFAQVGGLVAVRFHFIYYTSLVDADSVIILNDSVVKASINIPADAISPSSKVIVSDQIDGQLVLYTFRVNLKNKPSIVALSPSKGKPGDTLEIAVKGRNTHFKINNPSIYIDFKLPNGGNGGVGGSYKNDTLLFANVIIPPTASAGVYTMRLSANAEDDLYGTFNVETPCSAHYTTLYDSAANAFTLTLDSAATTAGKFYWSFGDGTTSTEKLPSHTFPLDTLYKVCLIVKTAAGDSCSYCHQIGKDEYGNPVLRKKGFSAKVIPFKPINSSISVNAQDAAAITVYPNPATDIITISSNKNVFSDLLVYSADGRLIWKQTLANTKTAINISGLEKGLYFLQVRDRDLSTLVKLVKN